MPLSEMQIKHAKPKDKPYKISDGNNLFLQIQPNGSKYWRHRYSLMGKEKMIALGVYPLISLADARELNFEARRQKAKGIDPAAHKKQEKLAKLAENENTFEKIARKWHAVKFETRSAYYAKQVIQRLEKDESRANKERR